MLCASRSPGPRKEQHERDDELYIESAPSHKNLHSCPFHVNSLPKSYTFLKRIFAFTMRLPPEICTICVPTFPRDFPQKDFTILVPTLSMCDSPRDIVRSTQIDMLSVIHRVICVQKAPPLRCSTCILFMITVTFLRPSLEPRAHTTRFAHESRSEFP